MAAFTPSQPPQLFKQDPYLLRWYNELIKRIESESYTKEELDNGALDPRYYTETELNEGQLNTLYYTEAELNAGQLDTRYYTESEVDALLTPNHALKTANYTLTDDDYLIECTGTWTLTLHTPATVREFIINNSGAGQITIDGTIQGDAAFILYAGEAIDLAYTGTSWLVT